MSYLYSVMLGSHDATEGPVLFMVDPSGLSWVGCSGVRYTKFSYHDIGAICITIRYISRYAPVV